MLRWILVALGVLLLAGGFATLHALPVVGLGAAIQLLLGGALLVFALLFEARRYRTPVRSAGGSWETTDERFIDPTTDKLMQVRYNPQTGERDYVDAGGP